MSELRFYDPLYGRIGFSEQDAKLIFAPEVQRLRYVRMCNINSLLISGASEISRFEHVIGVAHLAREWTRASGLASREASIVHAAALLHDVQTGPFGHSLEYILSDNDVEGDFRHEDILHGSQNQFLQLVSANVSFSGSPFKAMSYLGRDWEHVAEAIKGRGKFGAIIAGTIDLDNIDNVVRLAYHVGVAERADAQSCLALALDLRLGVSGLTISRGSIDHLLRWQQLRKRLYLLLLHDWAEFSAKAMLTAMMEQGVSEGIIGADSWRLTDAELLTLLTRDTVGRAQAIGELGRRLRLGDLFVPLGLWRTPTVDAYSLLSSAAFKRELESLLGDILRTRVIFHVILDQGKTERKLSLVIREEGDSREFGIQSSEVLIGVFVSREDFSALARNRAEVALSRALSAAGAEPVTVLDDPLVPANHKSLPPEHQLSFL